MRTLAAACGDDGKSRSLLTVDEAARFLSISLRSLQSLISKGLLPVVRIGRRVLICHEDLTAFIASRRTSESGR